MSTVAPVAPRRALRRLSAVLPALLLIAGCGSAPVTPSDSPAATRTPAVTASRESSTSPTNPASASVPASPATQRPSATAQYRPLWEPVRTMPSALDAYAPTRAFVLGDGRVLVVASDATASVWDPRADAWHATQGLNKPRAEYAGVTLPDGRVLIAGGLSSPAGGMGQCGSQSFSSSYVFDPASERWSSAGLLGAARTAPAIAVLHDGRVLIAGGYFFADDSGYCRTSTADLAAFRPSPRPARPGIRWNDVDPGVWGSALATAELFDPSTGTWSTTGHLVYAREGSAAVTLADGRVLVVGDGGQPVVAPSGSYESAEIYDPSTGRFTLTGSIPPLDRAALRRLGIPTPDDSGRQFGGAGTLVALPDGGALLVGFTTEWKHEAEIVRTLRYDPRAGSWTDLGIPYVWFNDWQADKIYETKTPNRFDAVVVRLLDSRVLVAGERTSLDATDTGAELFDPATGGWSALPPMPEHRSGGTAVTLADGSVLLVGGGEVPGSAVRFVPGA